MFLCAHDSFPFVCPRLSVFLSQRECQKYLLSFWSISFLCSQQNEKGKPCGLGVKTLVTVVLATTKKPMLLWWERITKTIDCVSYQNVMGISFDIFFGVRRKGGVEDQTWMRMRSDKCFFWQQRSPTYLLDYENKDIFFSHFVKQIEENTKPCFCLNWDSTDFFSLFNTFHMLRHLRSYDILLTHVCIFHVAPWFGYLVLYFTFRFQVPISVFFYILYT